MPLLPHSTVLIEKEESREGEGKGTSGCASSLSFWLEKKGGKRRKGAIKGRRAIIVFQIPLSSGRGFQRGGKRKSPQHDVFMLRAAEKGKRKKQRRGGGKKRRGAPVVMSPPPSRLVLQVEGGGRKKDRSKRRRTEWR